MPAYLGQHFLKNPAPARALVAALELSDADTVIEVGPGTGALTRVLAHAPHARIICIEKDIRLAATLVRMFADDPSITIIHGDIRELLASTVSSLDDTSWKLAGNIPYYLTSYLVRLMGDLPHPPVRAALLMQKEVAERISAPVGSFTKLAAFTGLWADTSIVRFVPRTAFSPPPRVDSAILSFIRHSHTIADRSACELLIRQAFTQPRKLLVNNLIAPSYTKQHIIDALRVVGLDERARPHDLSLARIQHLASLLYIGK